MIDESSSEDPIVAELAEEFIDRQRRGEQPRISEYIKTYPEHAAKIQDLFPAIQMVESLKPTRDEIAAVKAKPTTFPLERLGDYRILSEIGRGGMGVVYKAEQISLGRPVALKLLSNERVHDPKQRQRFEREARAAARLHHTNIVPVFGVGSEGEHSYYVMQFIEGLPLDLVLVELMRTKPKAAKQDTTDRGSKVIDRPPHRSTDPLDPGAPFASHNSSKMPSAPINATNVARSLQTGAIQAAQRTTDAVGPDSEIAHKSPEHVDRLHPDSGTSSSTHSPTDFTTGLPNPLQAIYWKSVARIGVQVAQALDYAHGQGVLHRDIKPSNLVLDRDGTVWITDFGLARLDDDLDLTGTGDVMGTLRYMAPETFKGKADGRSEIYALGLTLYELLALQPAFAQDSQQRLIDRVMQSKIEPLGRINAEIPSDLQTMIHKAIDADAAHRYQTGKEFADDLLRFIADEPIQARRVSLLERAWRWSRRNKALAISMTAVAVLVTAIAVSSSIAAHYFQGLTGKLNHSVTELTQTTGELRTARTVAAKEAAENLRLANVAEAARQTSMTMLADMQTERGLSSGEDGDPATAALWFANAATLTPHDSQRQKANRLRAQNWMNEAFIPVASMRFPNTGGRNRLTFQPGSDGLLTCKAGSLRIWNWKTEQSIHWADQLEDATDACWASDGRMIAIGTASGELQIRNSTSGEIAHVIKMPAPIEAIEYSSDGRRLAVSGGTVQVWDMAKKPVLKREWPHPAAVYSLSFDREGTRLVTACRDQQARIFSLDRDGQAPAIPPVPHAPLRELAPVFFDHDRLLITVLPNNEIGWWNSQTGADATPATTDKRAPWVTSLAAASDGTYFAAASANDVVIWSRDGERDSMAHRNSVGCVLFQSDSNVLATGGDDWTVRMWSVAKKLTPVRSIPQMEAISQMTFSNDDQLLAVCGADLVRVWKRQIRPLVVGKTDWNLPTCKPRVSFDGRWVTPGRWHQGPVADVAGPPALTVVDLTSGLPAGPSIPLSKMLDS